MLNRSCQLLWHLPWRSDRSQGTAQPVITAQWQSHGSSRAMQQIFPQGYPTPSLNSLVLWGGGNTRGRKACPSGCSYLYWQVKPLRTVAWPSLFLVAWIPSPRGGAGLPAFFEILGALSGTPPLFPSSRRTESRMVRPKECIRLYGPVIHCDTSTQTQLEGVAVFHAPSSSATHRY